LSAPPLEINSRPSILAQGVAGLELLRPLRPPRLNPDLTAEGAEDAEDALKNI